MTVLQVIIARASNQTLVNPYAHSQIFKAFSLWYGQNVLACEAVEPVEEQWPDG